ncbi:MAG: hypothetical protein K8T10_12750 [Candidatus Eremiobacteraeota bacterium]|nr:hypothetical protein [Candidatus Eremiobacteraeota bacterium]
MPTYRLQLIKSKIKRYIEKQQPKIQKQIMNAINNILKSPRDHSIKSGGIKHLKKGKYYCKWQSKEIYNFRIIYHISDADMSVRLLDIESHLDRQR